MAQTALLLFLFFVSLIFLLLRFVRRFLNMVQFDFTFFYQVSNKGSTFQLQFYSSQKHLI